MPLYIRDESVNELAARLETLTGLNKTEAVRRALQHEIRSCEQTESLHDRLTRLQAEVRAAGFVSDGFDDKPLMDDLSGGI